MPASKLFQPKKVTPLLSLTDMDDWSIDLIRNKEGFILHNEEAELLVRERKALHIPADAALVHLSDDAALQLVEAVVARKDCEAVTINGTCVWCAREELTPDVEALWDQRSVAKTQAEKAQAENGLAQLRKAAAEQAIQCLNRDLARRKGPLLDEMDVDF